MNTSIERVQPAEIVPQSETALMRATSMEATIAAAVEAQSRAVVQARYALAIRNPRDLDQFRSKILKECRRPGFAKVARYAKKQGKKKNEKTGEWEDAYVVGPSIRFAEAALRCFTNVLEEEAVIHDDAQRRVMRVCATDLESNLTYAADVIILKQVERSDGRGREVISTRLNSYGKNTYLVEATDDETMQKQGSLVSKALRKQVLRMLPGDVVEECMAQVVATQSAEDKADPDAQRKIIFDLYGVLGVSPAEIKEYIGHDIGLEDLPILRAIYQTLKQGDAKWSQLVAEKKAEAEGDAPTGDLTAKIKAKAEEAEKKAAEKARAKSNPPAASAPAWPTPDDLLHLEAAIKEAETPADLETARQRVAQEVPSGSPGRAALDALGIRRAQELQ